MNQRERCNEFMNFQLPYFHVNLLICKKTYYQLKPQPQNCICTILTLLSSNIHTTIYNIILFSYYTKNNDDHNNNVSYFCVAAGLLYSLLAHYQSTNHAMPAILFFSFVQRCRCCVADRFISCFMMMTSLIKIKSEHKNT